MLRSLAAAENAVTNSAPALRGEEPAPNHRLQQTEVTMNTKHIEHWYRSENTGETRKSASIDGKVATFFALVMAGLVGASALLIQSGEPEALGVVQRFHLQESAASQAAPVHPSALPEISPNAVEHQPPSF
jgi:hypothetical protein